MNLTINNVNVHYQVSGYGDNVILLHGWGGSIKDFEPVHRHLEKYFRTYSIDFPGFGNSSLPDRAWSTVDYLDILVSFMKELKIDEAIVIAHSFGGRVAIRLASSYPELIKKMILIDSAGIKPRRSLNYYIKVYCYKATKYILTISPIEKYSVQVLEFIRKRTGSKDYQNVSGIMRQTLIKVVNEDLKKLLPNINASTLLIWGENDSATPVRDGKMMERLIPNAGLVVLKKTGHFSYLEKLNEFLIIIDRFLKGDKEGIND